MNSISSLGSGIGSSHLQLLQDDSAKNGNSRNLDALRHGGRTSAPIDTAASSDSETSSNISDAQSGPQDDLLTKINNLIDNELSGGKLSSDRAAVLRNVFTNAFASTDDNESATSNAAAANATGATPEDPGASQTASASDSVHDVGSVLNDFLKLLQDAKSTASPYGASGSARAEAPARLINYKA